MTERYEITTLLQRELHDTQDIRRIEKGHADNPAIPRKVCIFYKYVSGVY
jgi:hypothetical protein